jgi:hypothetical protein
MQQVHCSTFISFDLSLELHQSIGAARRIRPLPIREKITIFSPSACLSLCRRAAADSEKRHSFHLWWRVIEFASAAAAASASEGISKCKMHELEPCTCRCAGSGRSARASRLWENSAPRRPVTRCRRRRPAPGAARSAAEPTRTRRPRERLHARP